MKKTGLIFLIVAALTAVCMRAQVQGGHFRYDSPYYWTAQGTKAIQAGKFDSAYCYIEKAHEGYRALGDIERQIQMLNSLGELEVTLGEWLKADSLYKEALRLASSVNDDYIQAATLIRLVTLYNDAGNITGYNKCLAYMDSLAARPEASLRFKTIYYIYMGEEFMKRNEYVMAEYHLQNLHDKVLPDLNLGDREQARLSYFSNMLALKGYQREYGEAVKYARGYVNQVKQLYGNGSDMYYQAYTKLASVYTLNNDSTNAFACLDSLARGVGRSYQDAEVMAAFYKIWGECYLYFKEYDKAVECFGKACDAVAERKTEDSPSKYESLAKKAEAYFYMNKCDEAYSTYLEYMQACKNKYGETSGSYYQTVITLAAIEGERGRISQADSLFRVSMDYLLSNMKGQWRYYTPSQREMSWKETQNNLGSMASFALECGRRSSRLTETCYNALLFSKAMMLEMDKSVMDVVRRDGTKEDVDNYNSLQALNNRLLALRRNYDYNKREIDSLATCQRRMEQQLTEKCKSYGEYGKSIDIDFAMLNRQLRANEFVVDFADYVGEDSTRQYTAYVFGRDSRYPTLVKCFRQQQLDSLLFGRQSYALYDSELVKDAATRLVWDSVRSLVPAGSTVYYVPSGAIHGIALEALPLDDGTTLGQHYKFVRLTSAREVARIHAGRYNMRDAALYGGLPYDLSPERMAEESKAYEAVELTGVVRSEYGTSGFKKLPGTRREVEGISKILSDSGYVVTEYMGAKGNAESFLALSGKSPFILHIATHGFYYTPEEAAGNNLLDGYTDAMSLSGLVFAGGNAAWLGKKLPDGVLGGVLRASDIASMDLRHTGLAVLSACKTAQGRVTAEGIYGLQRAFKKAGVGSIVMSLWNVSDKVTAEFMTAFYERLVDRATGGDRRKAFEQAREAVRSKHPEPYYWAAFVMLD